MSSFLQILDANKQFTVLSNTSIKQSALGIVSKLVIVEITFQIIFKTQSIF